MNTEENTFVKHIPCDACGSKDNNSLYTDGHTYCFGCETRTDTGNENHTPVSTLATDTNILQCS